MCFTNTMEQKETMIKIDTKSLKTEFHINDLVQVLYFHILALKQELQGGFYKILLVQNRGDNFIENDLKFHILSLWSKF